MTVLFDKSNPNRRPLPVLERSNLGVTPIELAASRGATPKQVLQSLNKKYLEIKTNGRVESNPEIFRFLSLKRSE